MRTITGPLVVSIVILMTSSAFAGGPGKKADASCPAPCQTQIDDLNSSQAQQNEILGAHGKQLQNHEGRITALEKADYDPWFIRVGARAAWMVADVTGVFDSQDSGPGFGGALAFGREFGALQGMGRFRAELEVAYQATDADTFNYGNVINRDRVSYDVDTKLTTVMINGYYEIPVYESFSVYGMAGLGYAKYDLDINESPNVFFDGVNSGSDNSLAYKAGVGISYLFTEQIVGDLGFEYLGVSDNSLATSINGYNAVGSVRFKF